MAGFHRDDSSQLNKSLLAGKAVFAFVLVFHGAQSQGIAEPATPTAAFGGQRKTVFETAMDKKYPNAASKKPVWSGGFLVRPVSPEPSGLSDCSSKSEEEEERDEDSFATTVQGGSLMDGTYATLPHHQSNLLAELQPSAQSFVDHRRISMMGLRPVDSFLYPSFSNQSENLIKDACGFPVQSESAVQVQEQCRSGNFYRLVDYDRRTEDTNLPSSKSSSPRRMTSTENKTFTGADTPVRRSSEFTPEVTESTHSDGESLQSFIRKERHKKDALSMAFDTDCPDDMLALPPPSSLTEQGTMRRRLSAAVSTPEGSLDKTRETELNTTSYFPHSLPDSSFIKSGSVAGHPSPGTSTMVFQGASTEQDKELSDLLDFSSLFAQPFPITRPKIDAGSHFYYPEHRLQMTYLPLHPSQKRSYAVESLHNPYLSSQSIWSPFPSAYSARENLTKDAFHFPVQSESEPGGDRSGPEEMGSPVNVEQYVSEFSDRLVYYDRRTEDSSLPSCGSSSLRKITIAGADTPVRRSSEFTPEVTAYAESTHSDGESFHSFIRKKRHKKDPFSMAFNIDYPDYTLAHPPPDSLTEQGQIGRRFSAAVSTPEASLDKTRETELNTTSYFPPSLPDSSFTKSSSTVSIPTGSQSRAPAVAGPQGPQGRPTVIQDSTVCTEISEAPEALESVWSDLRDICDVPFEMDVPVTAVNYSVTNTLPARPAGTSSDPWWIRRGSSRLSRSHSMPSLSQTLRAVESLPDMLLKSTSKEFTPDMAADGNDGSYRFWCWCPGLYWCNVTDLRFQMERAGIVDYRTVPWDRRLLARHHKRPAGPLFDIKCAQRSMSRLHLPHCEINGGRDFLSVAHVNDDDGVEFIDPHEVTESHIVINITGFSGFGNVKDEDSPPDPVRALVLLFYRPPADPDPESLLNVLLLPRNVVLQDVLRIRKKLVGDECYVETSPHCKLHPNRDYALSTRPQDNSLLVQPAETEFDCDNYDNFFPSFQVSWETTLRRIELFLRDIDGSRVWERRVCLSSAGVRRSCAASDSIHPPNERLLGIRRGFVEGISGPVLKCLLDRLFEKMVLTDSERESVDEMRNTRDKARFVVDMVRRKGEAASSEMIEFLCEVDPFLCEHLGLM